MKEKKNIKKSFFFSFYYQIKHWILFFPCDFCGFLIYIFLTFVFSSFSVIFVAT